jgi:hypothetical protein
VAHPLVVWPELGPRRPRVCRVLAPLRLIFGLRLVSGKIGGLAFVLSNFENISYVAFLKHKQQKIGNWHCGILLVG